MPAFGSGIVTFSTMHSDITGPPLIPGHGLTAGQQDPTFTWNYTGNYSDPRLPVYILPFNGNNQITICTNGACSSYPENDGFGQNYAGYEFIYFGFTLPANAINIVLNLDPYAFDDRVVVDLNGHMLGAWGATGGTSIPSIQCNAGGCQNETYTPQSVPQTVSTQSWFNPGGTNYVRFWLNNTGEGVYGNAVPHGSYNDPTAMQAWGAITYDTPTNVPALTPLAFAVLILLLGSLAVYGLRRPHGATRSD